MSSDKPHYWSKSDLDLLEGMWRNGLSDARIAQALNRTERAVACKRYKLGLAKNRGTRPDYGPSLKSYSDDALVDELNHRGYYCLREVREIKDYSINSLRTELYRRGYGTYRKDRDG